MQWYDIRDPDSPELDRLAEQYSLHPLHIEDCRHGRQRSKVEEGADYLFVILKPAELNKDCELIIGELDIFLGRDYLITVQETECKTVCERHEQYQSGRKNSLRADQTFYQIMDALVDTYAPIVDELSDLIDHIEDDVLESPTPELLQRIFGVKRTLIELRRTLANMRDVAGHLQRTETELIQRDMYPFLRDVYDHLARNMDLVETHRDLLTGAMDIYLSSVANRTNQVMKVLTVLGTIALPAIVISGFFGMNTKGMPLEQSSHGTWVALLLMVVSTSVLLYVLKRLDWW